MLVHNIDVDLTRKKLQKLMIIVLFLYCLLLTTHIFLMKTTYEIKGSNIVTETESNVTNETSVFNLKESVETVNYLSDNGTLFFSGYAWNIRNDNLSNPGPNDWSNSPQNVWIDSNGWLHLKITNNNGKWYCAEVNTKQTLGYGTYSFCLASKIDDLDKNVVLGLFSYKDDDHEVDIEFSRWGNNFSNNSCYTVQPAPYKSGITYKSFNASIDDAFSSHYFLWNRDGIYFESYEGDYSTLINSFYCSRNIDPEGVRAIMNLWLFEGLPPTDGNSVEIIIKSFSYTPFIN